jgi:Flavodoxin domain
MKAIVVFESMYGNTRHIAEAIADGIRWSMPAEVVLARDAADLDLDNVELVVVGGPTHAWGLSSKRTRGGAQQDAMKHPDHLLDTAQAGAGIREWLQEVHCNRNCRAVGFDTRLDKPLALTGSAARSIQRRLRHVGFASFDRPHSFRVTGMAGPLSPGEIDRAMQWGEAMGRTIVPFTERKLTPSRAAR